MPRRVARAVLRGPRPGNRPGLPGLTRPPLSGLPVSIPPPGRVKFWSPGDRSQVPSPWSQDTVLLLCYRCQMAVRKKRSISLPPDLDAEIAAAAEQAGMTYSSWLAATARKEFTIRAGLAAVAQFEAEHGAFTPGELADAGQWAAQATERADRTGTSARRRSA
jgi:hypothetical protein